MAQLIQRLAGDRVSLLLAASCLLNFLFFCVLMFRLIVYRRQQKELFRGKDAQSLESIILTQVSRVEMLSKSFNDMSHAIQILEKSGRKILKRKGFVRYNAFKDTSGEMSYSLALLDDEGDGFVITGIFSREENRTYVKQIHAWHGEAGSLSEEEELSVRKAYNDNT
ncbi:MAG: DUF4446 family protein [Peptococcaceae bacterium]|nr:DUF4446 family protein [Peptococcaceae bacterium]